MPISDHAHAVDLDDTFDFINTLEFSGDASTDEIETPGAALDWLLARDLVHPESVTAEAVGEPLVERLRTVRSALREVADAVFHRRAPARAALEEVNRTLRAREIVQLEPSDDGVHVGHRHVGDPIDDALARLAEPLVAEIAGGRPERLRVCANDACRWVFFDASPTGRRRWCSMASCGNRAKAARHRARVRATG
ncbi:MAG TPA: CGNR zinc finger domain-containing protein [Candidatus Limnocylindrales bacterium]|nr:CGNR zinc finger domain-containing protein [Candidatus Limnocylindrales bacterium]